MSPSSAAGNLDLERYLGHFRTMARIRAFEEAAIGAARDGLVKGAIHPSIGQEAIATGVCSNLETTDVLLSNHRGHGHTLAKGADASAMMCELLGRVGGTCGGKGGSMHIADFEVGMLGANGVVAANILVAAGAAHGIKLRGESKVVVCIFGDGAVNRGPFLEGLNWAGVYQLPVLFVCEDNGFAATTRTRTLTAGDGPQARAQALGLTSAAVDGNDVAAVDELVRDWLPRVRAGEPRFILAKTYRLTGHTAGDPASYRSDEEVARHWGNDPIERCAELLRGSGVEQARLDAIRAEAGREMRAALETGRDAPWPELIEAYRDVQDVGAPVPPALLGGPPR